MEFTRITRKYVTVDVTATLAAGSAASITGVDVALLPINQRPTGDTVWVASTYASGTATVLIAGPEADPTGADLVLTDESDLWIRVPDTPEIDAARVTRISVPSAGGPAPASGVTYVTTTMLNAALAGLSGGGGGGSYTDEQVRDVIAAALVAGANVTIVPDDAGDTITLSAATDPEVVRDTIGATLVAGSNVTITVNDAANTITISAAGGAGSPADATTTTKGVVQLAGDLAGTAAAPTVPGLAGKAATTDPRFTDTRTPTDGSVTDAKVATGAAISADKLADGTGNKVLSAAERTKLAGVATGATANATDAQLRDRSTHTGTQSADTLTDGTTNKAFLATERTKLTGIATGATANATDAQLRDRSTHTGTQAASTVTGLAPAVALVPTATKTATYTAAVGDLAMMNVAGGAATLNLPAAPTDKSQVGYRAIGATTGAPLTINRGGSDTIGTAGATSVTISLADEIAVLQYDAANTRWLAVSNVKTQASLDARYEAVGNALLKSANLSDLASAATSRTNLGLGTAAVVNTGTASGDLPLLSTGGRLPVARLASGTPDGTKFVRDDGTLAVPAGGGGGSTAAPSASLGALAVSFDPAMAPTAGASQGTGRILLARVPWTAGLTVTNILAHVATAGATLTSGQNLACLYDSSGTQISGTTTADQSTAWTSTGIKTMAIGTPQVIPADPNGYLYVALLTVGTTPPIWAASPGAATFPNIFLASNVGQRAGLLASTGNTSLPGTATLTTMTSARIPLVALN